VSATDCNISLTALILQDMIWEESECSRHRGSSLLPSAPYVLLRILDRSIYLTNAIHLWHQTTKARAAVISLPHGSIDLPVFMPVGSKGSVKGSTAEQVEDKGDRPYVAGSCTLQSRTKCK